MKKDNKIHIGKNGITGALVAEIKTQLRKRGELKVNILKSARTESDRKEIAAEVADRTNSHLLQVRGNTFILSRWTKSKKR